MESQLQLAFIQIVILHRDFIRIQSTVQCSHSNKGKYCSIGESIIGGCNTAIRLILSFLDRKPLSFSPKDRNRLYDRKRIDFFNSSLHIFTACLHNNRTSAHNDHELLSVEHLFF